MEEYSFHIYFGDSARPFLKVPNLYFNQWLLNFIYYFRLVNWSKAGDFVFFVFCFLLGMNPIQGCAFILFSNFAIFPIKFLALLSPQSSLHLQGLFFFLTVLETFTFSQYAQNGELANLYLSVFFKRLLESLTNPSNRQS